MGPLKKAPTPSSRHRIAKASKKEEIKEKERVGLGRLYMCGVRSSSYKDQYTLWQNLEKNVWPFRQDRISKTISAASIF